MKKYETPDIEIIYFEAEDIITTSGPDQGGGEIGGGGDWG